MREDFFQDKKRKYGVSWKQLPKNNECLQSFVTMFSCLTALLSLFICTNFKILVNSAVDGEINALLELRNYMPITGNKTSNKSWKNHSKGLLSGDV